MKWNFPQKIRTKGRIRIFIEVVLSNINGMIKIGRIEKEDKLFQIGGRITYKPKLQSVRIKMIRIFNNESKISTCLIFKLVVIILIKKLWLDFPESFQILKHGLL